MRRMWNRPASTEGMALIAIESGATEHVINNHRLYMKIQILTPVPLSLTDGSVMNTEYEGEI